MRATRADGELRGAQALQIVWALGDADIVGILNTIGVDTDQIVHAIAVMLGISDEAATAIVCVTLPFVCL